MTIKITLALPPKTSAGLAPPASPGSELLSPSELELLRRSSNEAIDLGLKLYGQKETSVPGKTVA